MLSSLLQRMTIVCRQRSIRRKISLRDQNQLHIRKSKLSQPLQCLLRQSLALFHNKRKVNKLPYPFLLTRCVTIPFHKGCDLWNRRAFMVRIMASAKDNCGLRVWSPEEERIERDAEAFGCTSVCPVTLERPLVPAHLRAIRCQSLPSTFPTKKMFALWTANQKYNNTPGLGRARLRR